MSFIDLEIIKQRKLIEACYDELIVHWSKNHLRKQASALPNICI